MKNLTIAFLAAASLFTVGACKKKNSAAEAVAKMGELKEAMCKCTDKACADKVQADYVAYGKSMEGKKDEKPDQATIDKMMGLMGDYEKCAQKAMGAGDAGSAAAPTPPPPAAGSAEGSAAGSAAPAAGSADGSAAAAAPAAGGGDLPQECKDYQAAIENLAKCDKLPAQAKDALKNAYEQQAKAWASVPAEGRAALATGCKTAVDAVKQSAAMCN